MLEVDLGETNHASTGSLRWNGSTTASTWRNMPLKYGLGNGWKSVASGQAIGHEKMDRFPPVTASRIRLNILSSSQEAHIREFQVYSDTPANQ